MSSPALGASQAEPDVVNSDNQQVLDSLLDACARQQAEKPHYFLLQRACILSSLSQRMYEPAQIISRMQPQNLQLTRLPYDTGTAMQTTTLNTFSPAVPEATLLSGPQTGLPVCAIWSVKNVGIVVAFRGTDGIKDIFTDICFAPKVLSGSSLLLHGAVYQAAAQCLPHIQAVYAETAQQCNAENKPPLFLTGTANMLMLLTSTFMRLQTSLTHCPDVIKHCPCRTLIGWRICKLLLSAHADFRQ